MAPVAQNRSDACVPAYSPRAAPPCGIPTETPCKSELILAESSGLFLLKISAWLLIWGGVGPESEHPLSLKHSVLPGC